MFSSVEQISKVLSVNVMVFLKEFAALSLLSAAFYAGLLVV